VPPANPRPVLDVTGGLGLDPRDVTVWGERKAKVSLDALARSEPTGRLILVSAISPMPAGEVKTTTTIDLAKGLAAGAGYVVRVFGNMQRMPGLSESPQAERMDLRDGSAVGVL
jgi:formyltetrahydrofolate synthetase